MLKITGETHMGVVRKQNQDMLRWSVTGERLGYAIVCDGMGGEKAGAVASAATVEIVDCCLKKGLIPGMNVNSVRALMLTAVNTANAMVFEQARRNPDFTGMGTTLVLAVVYGDMLHTCHVGDSRIYKIEGRDALQLTRDHSMVQMLVDKGELTPSEAEIHPKKHYITRAVGVAPRIDPDYGEYPFEGRQVLLLCSDGLSNYLTQTHVAQEVWACVKAETVAPLIDYALKSGGADNITAVLLTLD